MYQKVACHNNHQNNPYMYEHITVNYVHILLATKGVLTSNDIVEKKYSVPSISSPTTQNITVKCVFAMLLN